MLHYYCPCRRICMMKRLMMKPPIFCHKTWPLLPVVSFSVSLFLSFSLSLSLSLSFAVLSFSSFSPSLVHGNRSLLSATCLSFFLTFHVTWIFSKEKGTSTLLLYVLLTAYTGCVRLLLCWSFFLFIPRVKRKEMNSEFCSWSFTQTWSVWVSECAVCTFNRDE